MTARVTVVGIGGDGWAGLDAARRSAVLGAEVVLGGDRHLAMLPAEVSAEQVPWTRPFREGVAEALARFADRRIVALASGDPLVAGAGTTFVELLGAEAVEVLPAVSSVALARARMRWPAESVAVLRDHRTLSRELAPGRRLLVLSADRHTPSAVAAVLRDTGFGGSEMIVLAELGSPAESCVRCTARDWEPGREAPQLHVLAIECVADASARPLGLAPGLPDDAFENDGQLTRRDLRASALSRLAPSAGELLWDVGAGAGSVGIEWMRMHPTCRAIAVEADPERAARIGRNAAALGVPSLEIVEGRAPGALEGLPRPDAAFIGGGGTAPGLLRRCWDALAPGGRLVAHAVTLETERVMIDARAEFGGELTRFFVERSDQIGSFTGWAPARAVVQWAAVKPRGDAMEGTS
ncbi:precorrin-6y C5,15-methyltransferase (decarboxylating) subunit CbiE [Dietzia cinnamea]|uniref:precorrin-6y C5,15-methyltransferase (decarboxylating) subunit CbiE n=1 Tax=Dietzia cinnamea TaxID=321318 RepID=UPI0021AE9F03|nr:precorrin-6y C5,15-methyltransferase (decarboxylating) subunit CbiE [Dietzia cinnamea]MCT2062347.1 precorrin-6y C5,15-methyltransferase (decarboxylating) subunit CbiE [Dietzia cinnamea]MCT2237418.1 precorrin-6y C5,15-methyltransferase (decarboxylating) subunit CbiE [Dietzia cinnamea]MCT2302046.1 precorrin-6y C5,15-methyltransferase (decarboxylating) subunit CbiE [Dietzia cinnamea]